MACPFPAINIRRDPAECSARRTENRPPDEGLQMKPDPSAAEAPEVEVEQFTTFAPAEYEINIVNAFHLAIDR